MRHEIGDRVRIATHKEFVQAVGDYGEDRNWIYTQCGGPLVGTVTAHSEYSRCITVTLDNGKKLKGYVPERFAAESGGPW